MWLLRLILREPVEEQFVIQRHLSGSEVHWDLMLQSGESLRTWRIGVLPEEIKEEAIDTVKIADHPLKFLTYEGDVKNNTGQVRIVDRGGYEVVGGDEKKMIMQMNGQVLRGRFIIEHIENDNWRFQRAID